MTRTYPCGRFPSIGRFQYTADFDQASSAIVVRFESHDEDAWQPVPFQVVDCKHDRREAERKIAAYFR